MVEEQKNEGTGAWFQSGLTATTEQTFGSWGSNVLCGLEWPEDPVLPSQLQQPWLPLVVCGDRAGTGPAGGGGGAGRGRRKVLAFLG